MDKEEAIFLRLQFGIILSRYEGCLSLASPLNKKCPVLSSGDSLPYGGAGAEGIVRDRDVPQHEGLRNSPFFYVISWHDE